jgi:hypothetical protein
MADPETPNPGKPRKTVEVVPDPGWPTWRYTGPERIYSHIPITVQDGDVLVWPQLPADDGSWASTTSPATTLPDNYRPEE